MSVPDEFSIYCNECDVYNIGADCCICRDCMERIVNEELMKVIKILGISIAGKYRCEGAVELSKTIKKRFVKGQNNEGGKE